MELTKRCTVHNQVEARVHSFGHFLTKKREISRTFAPKKWDLLSWPSFGQFRQKCELFVKVRAISLF
jgi:hypothetical protein